MQKYLISQTNVRFVETMTNYATTDNVAGDYLSPKLLSHHVIQYYI